MFTGIIEEIGEIQRIKATTNAMRLTITAEHILKDLSIGDSLAINGVCLTVTSFDEHCFAVDVMPETLQATTLKHLTFRAKVNIERALATNGRLGGHFVTGHVDGTGQIIKKTPVANAVYFEIKANKTLLRDMILKGSVAVDGTSLTIFALTEQSFTLSLIPHTVAASILGHKDIGDTVNIECDMLAKYLRHFISCNRNEDSPVPSAITTHFLEEHGYK
ncbi:riboflavin synthase [Pullulanibacillus camelliae]|uniref:Riboflavin synthase n=1 Tax=Pullulanibacillus camelliae TaxID=1707096 RepID=A0A8J3DV41_9BACL|nr:riboflavin synthase [Pullulanibacillus camelliae]GGE44106.1 riboflavin synthase [Pullulanibacillus camelliae]